MKKIIIIFLGAIILVLMALGITYISSGGPHEIINKVRLSKTSEEVFDFCSDMRNELKWNPNVQHVEKITEGDVGLGTKFRAKWNLSDTIIVTIQQFDRPQHFTFVNGGDAEVTVDIKLTPFGNETELEARFVVTPHGFLRTIFPVFLHQIRKQEKENMINLKRVIEANN